jgi:hypothetical protein
VPLHYFLQSYHGSQGSTPFDLHSSSSPLSILTGQLKRDQQRKVIIDLVNQGRFDLIWYVMDLNNVTLQWAFDRDEKPDKQEKSQIEQNQ